MKEVPQPTGNEERHGNIRSLIHRAMVAHPDPDIRQLWGYEVTNDKHPHVTLSTADVIVDSIALTLAPKTRTELITRTRAFLKDKEEVIEEQELLQHPDKGSLAQIVVTKLTSLLDTPASRIYPEKADLDFRTDIASATAQLQLVTNPNFVDTVILAYTGQKKTFSKIGISFAERLRAIGHMTTVTMNTTLRQMKAERDGSLAKK